VTGGCVPLGFYVRVDLVHLVLLWERENLNIIGKSVVFSYDYISGGEINGTYMCYARCSRQVSWVS
jgi:hypothetical protein